jgi:UDP-3-O-[3-hydroxymyristoyl] glucosamine N-acyltransferase
LGKSLKQLTELVGGKLVGDPDLVIESAAPIETATTGQITFIANTKYKIFLDKTAASAVVLSLESKFNRIPVIKHKDPYYAFALILDALYPDDEIKPGIDSTAVVEKTAKVSENCTIGALSYIGNHSTIGNSCRIMPKVFIGKNVSIGDNCKLYPGVNILDNTKIGDNVIIHSGTVIGSDGFGYARHDKGIKKIKQIGWVEIGNDAEIGSNVSVDKGALGATKIGNHVKIDNLVQIAHNVEIGDYSIIVSQAGISGSTKLGKGVILAGQVGLVGHIKLGDGVTIGAQSGVTKDIPAGKTYFGSPAREIMKAKRIELCQAKLPELFKKIKKLEKN